MAVFSGPEIVNDGLVFHYDMDNVQKSWKGKPTTNLFSNPTNLASGWTTNNTSYNSSTQKAYITSNSSGNYFLQDRSLTSGLEYTISLEAKASESYIIQLTPSTGFTIADYANINLIDGSISGTATGISKANSFYLGKGWWRVSYTETATSTGSGRIAFAIGDDENYTRLSSASGLNVNDGLFIRAAQFEQNSFATPFVNGTRSNTEALIDLTGSETITAQSLTYNSDGTFTMSSGDYLTLSNDCPTIFGTGSVSATIEMWVKPQVTHNKVFCGQQNTTNERLYLGAYNNLWDFGWGGTAWDSGVYTGTRPSCVANVWQHVVFSIDAGVASLYKNGAFAASKTDTTVIMTGTFPIGTYYSSGVKNNGYDSAKDITDFKIYNKALTAAEVKQNFEATRSRYGI